MTLASLGISLALRVQESEDDPSLTAQARASLSNEAESLLKFGQSQFIVRLRGICYRRVDVPEAKLGRILGIVLDYCPGGDLLDCHR